MFYVPPRFFPRPLLSCRLLNQAGPLLQLLPLACLAMLLPPCPCVRRHGPAAPDGGLLRLCAGPGHKPAAAGAKAQPKAQPAGRGGKKLSARHRLMKKLNLK